jgi:dihydrolipoamide dehydrogenase
MAGTYDIAVIGGGPGGYVAAIRAGQLGAKVACIEKSALGGTCVNVGCIPTKALLSSSELFAQVKRGAEMGVVADDVRFDLRTAQQRKAKVVQTSVAGIKTLFRANGVELIEGGATLLGNGKIKVGGQELTAKDVILATGSVPARIPIKGVEHTVDSTGILELQQVPKRLVVIGGGVVGMEFASLYSELGAEVTVLEMLPSILAMVEPEISGVYRKHLEKLGGKVLTEAKVEEVSKNGSQLTVRFGVGGEGAEATGDVVLLAAGRTPYTEGLGLAEAGVDVDGKKIKVDDHLRTSADGVWAIGDVIARIQLAHVASYEGVCVVESIAAGHDRKPDYHAAPNCIYTDPEIANVGMTEAQAREAGHPVKVGRFPLLASGRARTLGQTEGLVKIVADATDGRLLGVQMVGARVTELIAEATIALQHGLTIEDVDLTIHAHPTMAESFLQAALAAEGRAIDMPNKKESQAGPAERPAAAESSPTKEVSAVARNVEENKAAATPIEESTPDGKQTAARPQAPPMKVEGEVKLDKKHRDDLMRLYEQMVLIRRFEERAQEAYTKAKIGGYCHLNIGEEATVVGGIAPLRAGDYIYTSYREHGHAIARGVDPRAVMAELFGRETGAARGRGGSMHIFDYAHRFMGGYGIVGGHLPLATGAAFAIKYQKRKDIVFCMFGDGATNIGAFHESLNFAKVFKLPVVWYCINNKYGMGTPVDRASAVADIYKRACAYDMEAIQIDGNKVVDVLNRTHEIIEKTRKDSEPRFIEAVCYRFKGHSVVDPDKYRDEAEKKKYLSSDPIHMFEVDLENAKLASAEDFGRVKEKVEKECEEIYQYADDAPNPKLEELYKYVYSDDWSERMPKLTPGGVFEDERS